MLLNEKHLLRAEVETSWYDPKRKEVRIHLTPEGIERFSTVTKENVGNKLAIIYQGKLLSAPVINQQITSKSVPITGNFTKEEAEEMAAKLNSLVESASIVAPVTVSITFVSLKTNKNVLQFTWKLTPTEPVLRQLYMFHQKDGKPAGYWGGRRLHVQ